MTGQVCDGCGAHNSIDAIWCSSCEGHLWQKGATSTPTPQHELVSTAAPPTPTLIGVIPPRIEVKNSEVAVDPTGVLDVGVTNLSTLVEAYAAELVNPPPWLMIDTRELHLNPGTAGELKVGLTVAPDTFVEAQRVAVLLRVRARADRSAFAEALCHVTVPRIGEMVVVHASPSTVRLTDAKVGRFSLKVDNFGSNYPQPVEVEVRDDEDAVRFRIAHPRTEVPAAGQAVVDIEFEADGPPPGQELSRRLSARVMTKLGTAEAVVMVIQKTSPPLVDPPVRLELTPSHLRIMDSATARVEVMIDNRSGTRDRTFELEGRDPEGAIEFAFRNPVIVKAGTVTRTRVQLRMDQPAPGEEILRSFVVRAVDGDIESETGASITHRTSPPALTAARLRLEPEQQEVLDRPHASVRVIVENTGPRSLRAQLIGSDPERAVAFQFAPDVLEVPGGGTGTAELRITAAPPAPGKVSVRQLQILLRDGPNEIRANATWTQITSEPAIRNATLVLNPDHVRVRDTRSAQMQVVVANESRTQSLQVRLGISDPEGTISAEFEPSVLDIAPLAKGAAALTVSADQPVQGAEVTRPFIVTARDDRGVLSAQGTFAQQTSAAPIAAARLRLDPEQVRIKNLVGKTFVIVDNSSGVLPLHVQLFGADPERVVTFEFTPSALSVPPGQVETVQLSLHLPAEKVGDESIRTIRVAAFDGSARVEATGTLLSASRRLSPIPALMLPASVSALGLAIASPDHSEVAAFGWIFFALMMVGFLIRRRQLALTGAVLVGLAAIGWAIEETQIGSTSVEHIVAAMVACGGSVVGVVQARSQRLDWRD